jgi:hypothetical protein
LPSAVTMDTPKMIAKDLVGRLWAFWGSVGMARVVLAGPPGGRNQPRGCGQEIVAAKNVITVL